MNNNRIPTQSSSGHKKVASVYDIGSNTVTVNSSGQFVVMGPNPTAVANLIASVQGAGEMEIRNSGDNPTQMYDNDRVQKFNCGFFLRSASSLFHSYTASTFTSPVPSTSRTSTTTRPPTELLLNQAQTLLTQSSVRPGTNNQAVLPGQLVQLPNGQLQVRPGTSVVGCNNNRNLTQVPSSSQTNQINLPSTSMEAEM